MFYMSNEMVAVSYDLRRPATCCTLRTTGPATSILYNYYTFILRTMSYFLYLHILFSLMASILLFQLSSMIRFLPWDGSAGLVISVARACVICLALWEWCPL